MGKETRAIPLQLVPVVAFLFFWVGIIINMVVYYPAILQRADFTIAAIAMAGFFGFLLFLGLLSLIFHKIKIEEDGITFQTPYVRILKRKPFPMHMSFDEIRIKRVWGGRILVFKGVKGLKLSKRALLFGGTWIMPIRWRECIKTIKTIKPEVLLPSRST